MTSSACRGGRWSLLGIFAMVIGFIVWWPLGLAVIGYILWGGSIDGLVDDAVAWARSQLKGATNKTASVSGNAAFDDYRTETLKRLDEEQAEFAAYVKKLREARDAEEFQRFMAERRGA